MRNPLLVILLAAMLAPGLAMAQPATEAEQPPAEFLAMLDLAEAYQTGYLQVVAVCCYQLYASTGVVATDFANGYIDPATALYALDENGLLHSVCSGSLESILAVTPADDAAALAELGRLRELLAAEGELLAALREVCVNPGDDMAAAVQTAREKVERLLEAYTTNMAPAQPAAS